MSEHHTTTPTLPPFLVECPTEPEDIPLQVQLLTMEVAAQRIALAKLAALLGQAAADVAPAEIPDHG